MKVLLATDGSENAESAVRMLSEMPNGQNVQLTVISVVQMPDLHHVLGDERFKKQFLSDCKAKIEPVFEGIRESLSGKNYQVEHEILEGHPGKMIVEFAEQHEFDLVIVGAVGESLIDRILLGSTSEFVATHATCSVLVVRPEKPESRHPSYLISYDGSEQAQIALQQVAKSGWAGCCPIDLVQVVCLPESLLASDDSASLEQDVRADTLESMEDLAETPALAALDITARLVESPHVGKGLCQFAVEHESKIIVMGSTGRGLIARFLLGSVSRYVLQNAPCSVWIGRQSKQS